MINAVTPGIRSNRQSTQRVLTHVASFYLGVSELHKAIIGPIRLQYDHQQFSARINGNLVLILKKGGNAVVTNGGYLDAKGNPTAATRELINGVFDTLEAQGLAPHVRAYVEDNVGRIRIGEAEHLLNADVSHQLVN